MELVKEVVAQETTDTQEMGNSSEPTKEQIKMQERMMKEMRDARTTQLKEVLPLLRLQAEYAELQRNIAVADAERFDALEQIAQMQYAQAQAEAKAEAEKESQK